jgi:hypothetical protein
LFLATVSTSVLVQAAGRSPVRRTPLLARGLLQAFVLRSPGEVFVASLLMYHFRLLERHMGSGKFAAYAAYTFAVGHVFQAILRSLFHRPSASGPYSLIFSHMIAFFLEVPPLQTFSILGVGASDKMFVYLAALQLLLAAGQRSLAAGLCGAVAGAAYHLNLFGLRSFRVSVGTIYLFCQSFRMPSYSFI